MEKMTSYVFWNNKSGTGKSTMVFQLSAAYAVENTSQKVVVIDMCPEYNVSTTLLRNPPTAALSLLTELRSSKIPYDLYRTSLSGYLYGRLDRRTAINDYQHFLTHVKLLNPHFPENVYLLIGDHNNAELTIRLDQERHLPPTNIDNPWRRVTLFIKEFIEGLVKTNINEHYCFFIDTDSSVSIYTQMAITAAKSLIVPFTADESSLSALDTMLCLIYRHTTKTYIHTGSFDELFFSKAYDEKIEFPKLHLFIFNKATYYTKKDDSDISPSKTPAYAFAAIRNQYGKVVYNVSKLLQSNFESCNSVEEFRKKYIIDVHDFRSLGVLSTHVCCPFSKLKSGQLGKVYDITVPIDSVQLKLYKEDIQNIVQKLNR